MTCSDLQLSDTSLTDSGAYGLDCSLDAIEQLREIASGILVLLLLLQHEPGQGHAVGVKRSIGHFF